MGLLCRGVLSTGGGKLLVRGTGRDVEREKDYLRCAKGITGEKTGKRTNKIGRGNWS